MSSNIRATLLLGAAAVVTTAVSILSWQCVSKYGFEGALRYAWEGNPHPPEIRDSIKRLEKVERSIQKESLLGDLEESLARARLDSVDGVSVVVPLWMVAHAPRNLEHDLAKVSHDLDTLAANVDSVASHGDAGIKLRKKQCSQQVVRMMERADILLACYQQENTTK
jgi:hypothetical protein